MNSHFAAAVAPGREARRRDRAALTSGLMVRASWSSIAITELNGSPVALTPSLARASSPPSACRTSANTNGFETLWIENSTSASPTAKISPVVPATAIAKSSEGTAASA